MGSAGSSGLAASSGSAARALAVRHGWWNVGGCTCASPLESSHMLRPCRNAPAHSAGRHSPGTHSNNQCKPCPPHSLVI